MQITKPSRLASFNDMRQDNLKTKVLSFISKQNIQPTYEEYLSLNTALQTGDVEMDRLLEWVMLNPKQHRIYFETALYQGLDKVPNDIPELHAFFNYIEATPSWVDTQKVDDALTFFYRLGANSGFILRDVALMPGYLYPGLNQPLILTGALNQHAAKRLAETTKWLMDITEKDGFNRFNNGFTSTVYVRFIHALVRYQLKKSHKWDAETWGLPINQYDQAMTNIAFSGVVLLGIRAIGIFPNKREIECYLHFWKYAGWLMGIEEKWLMNSEAEGWKYLHWLPFTHPPADESSLKLGSSLAKEPFAREYKYFKPLQQKLAYHQHLSITQYYIGKKKMKDLGLKHRFAPWFAYYLFARNSVVYTGAKHIPKLNSFLIKNGRKQQQYSLDLYKDAGKQLATMHR